LTGKYKFFWINNFTALAEPSNNSSISNDLIHYIKTKDKGYSRAIKKEQVSIINGVVSVMSENISPIPCSPEDTFFFLPNSVAFPLENILLDLGFTADTYTTSERLVDNKILTQYYLKKLGFPVLDFKISSPFKEYPFIAKTWDHKDGDEVGLIEDANEFFDKIRREDQILVQKFISKKIQTSYKVLVFFGEPIFSILRINSEEDNFTTKLWKQLLIPLSMKANLRKLEKVIFNNQYTYNYEILSTESFSKNELSTIREAFKQEGIPIKKNDSYKFKRNTLESLAVKVAQLFKLGKCEIDFIKHNDHYYILDIKTKINPVWKEIGGFARNSQLIFEVLNNRGFFNRKVGNK